MPDKLMICKLIQEGVKLFISLSMVYIIWNHIFIYIYIYIYIYNPNPIDVSYACFKNLSKTYLQTNDNNIV